VNTATFLLTAGLPVVLLIATILFRHAIGTLSLHRLAPYQYAFYFAFMIQGVIGMYLALWGARNHIGFRLVTAEGPYVDATIAVLCGVLFTPIGMIVCAHMFSFRPTRDVPQYLDQPMRPFLSRSDDVMFRTLLVLTMGIAIFAIWLLQDSPLRLSLDPNANAVDLAKARVEYEFADPNSIRIVQNIFGTSLTAVIAYITFAWAVCTRRFRWRLLFAVQLIPVLGIQAISLAKASAAQFALGLMFVYVVTRGRITTQRLLLVTAAISCLLLGSYVAAGTDYKTEGGGVATLLDDDNPVGRTIVGQLAGMPNYFQTFPDQHPFLYGSELQLLALFGERPKTAARISMEALLPDGVMTKTVGMQNTFFTGAAYANFGWVGVLLAPVWVGFVLQGTQLVVTRLEKNPVTVGWGVWVMYQFSKAIGGGFVSEFVANTNVLGTSLIVALIVAVAKCLHDVGGPRRRQHFRPTSLLIESMNK